MDPALALAFVAGILTVAAPCSLPVVPLIVGSSLTGDRRNPLLIVAGFASAFLLVTVVLASTLAAAGVTSSSARLLAAIVLGLLGLTLLVPALEAWRLRRLAPLANAGARLAGGRLAGDGLTGDGLAGGTFPVDGLTGGRTSGDVTPARAPDGRSRRMLGDLVRGAAIGLIWAPCVGPIMAGVVAAAVSEGPSLAGLAVATAYVAGASVPLLLIAAVGRRAMRLAGGPRRREWGMRLAGLAMVVASVSIVTGADRSLVDAFAPRPAQVSDLAGPQATPPPAAAREVPVAEGLLDDLGPAPELAGITEWLNSPPLTLASLRGRVVLVHFWTFACSNCRNVQPYVKAWHERYEKDGLVVVGVHTPELSFEREFANVADAVARHGVRFPVAFDPAFATRKAYANRYWPAFYFVDKSGRIRHIHFGEGDYDGSEAVIRALLAEAGG